MSYHHFTIEERCCLREFYNKGYSYRKIAELLGRNVSSISREIMRNKSFMNAKPAYYPHTAQKKYLLRRSYCHRGMFQDAEKLEYIKQKLLLTWSPEQISNTPCELKNSGSLIKLAFAYLLTHPIFLVPSFNGKTSISFKRS